MRNFERMLFNTVFSNFDAKKWGPVSSYLKRPTYIYTVANTLLCEFVHIATAVVDVFFT